MQDKKILVIGSGKIGGRVARELANEFQVTGLRRTPQDEQDKLKFIAADVTDRESLNNALQAHLSEGVDYLLYCLTPGKRDAQSYQKTYVDGLTNVLDTLPKRQRLKRLVFISSSSVYHQNDDQWIDESSPCHPTSFSGKSILEAENILTNSQVPYTIVRFSGIYGGTRRQLINQILKSAEEKTAILSNTLRRSNRIHEDDCVGFIAHLIRKASKPERLESIYLASDNEPVDLNEVILWLADALNVTISMEKTEQVSRRSGNKKCANRRMLSSGYVLRYSSYKDGYREMLA